MPDHSPLPWRLSAQRGREVLDADGETVLTVWPACGSPARALFHAPQSVRIVRGTVLRRMGEAGTPDEEV